MKEEVLKMKEKAIQEIQNAEDLNSLENCRVNYLGKKGELTAVLRGMGSLSAEEFISQMAV